MSDLSDAIEELHREGTLNTGWTVKGDDVELAVGDKMPTEQEMANARTRRSSRLAIVESKKGTDKTAILAKLGLTEEQLQQLKVALALID